MCHIGKVAQETGLSIDTIRFYERAGLLREPRRSESGYRLYDQNAVNDLKFIRRAKERGFALAEIRELLVLRRRSAEACPRVKSLLEEKLASVRAKRREIETMEKSLRRSLVECRGELKRRQRGRAESCPVLMRLGGQA